MKGGLLVGFGQWKKWVWEGMLRMFGYGGERERVGKEGSRSLGRWRRVKRGRRVKVKGKVRRKGKGWGVGREGKGGCRKGR